jgi:hypothetical protein
MTEICLHNKNINSIFQLLGEHENDISYSVAWALAQCPSFLQVFISKLIGIKTLSKDIAIRLQHHEDDSGITDIEIESPNEFHLILEAKRGWNLPSEGQLQKYSKRASFVKSIASIKLLVALSECSQEYASLNLPVQHIGSIPIKSVSWKDMFSFADIARIKTSSSAEKRLLKELLTYLGDLMTMDTIESNWVYVVSLGSDIPSGWAISWIDIVKKESRYFHPVGGNGRWPKAPPNYIAFRYAGKLQSIHRIEAYEVVTNMHKKIPGIPSEQWEPHFLYKLGPAFSPANEVKTGNIYPNGRVWCMLDTLFTSESISKARDISQERKKKE